MIKVPESGLTAAWQAVAEKMRQNIEIGSSTPVAELHIARVAVEAFCLWLSEHPQVPTHIQMNAAMLAAAHEPMNSSRWLSDVLMEFQRRMFLVREHP